MLFSTRNINWNGPVSICAICDAFGAINLLLETMKMSCCVCAMHPNKRWKIYENDSASFPLRREICCNFSLCFPVLRILRAPLIRIFIQSIHSPACTASTDEQHVPMDAAIVYSLQVDAPSFLLFDDERHREWKSWNGTWLPCVLCFAITLFSVQKSLRKYLQCSAYPVLCIRNFKLVRTFIMRRRQVFDTINEYICALRWGDRVGSVFAQQLNRAVVHSEICSFCH